MKKLITFLIMIASFLHLKAQGNLQFNTTKFIELTATISNPNVPPYYYKDSTITVPPGKVWKIESVTGTSSCTSNNIYLLLSGRLLCGNTSYGVFPIWLSQGTYPFVIHSNIQAQSKAAINLIEFNIVP